MASAAPSTMPPRSQRENVTSYSMAPSLAFRSEMSFRPTLKSVQKSSDRIASSSPDWLATA